MRSSPCTTWTGPAVADAARAIVTFPAIAVDDPELLLRAVEVYENDRLDFAEAYLVAARRRRVRSVELLQP